MAGQFNLSGYRQVTVLQTDTLQRIALRELGDAERWPDIAQFNDLHPPYISTDSSYASDAQVVAPGATILVPTAASQVNATASTDVLGADLRLVNGELVIDGGDLAVVSGMDNLSQALKVRIGIDKEELVFHPEFGSWIRKLIGTGAGPTTAQLAALYVRSALIEDDRVQQVTSVTTVVNGDKFNVTAKVQIVSGQTVSLSMVV
jgi:phage baseplate assembly protein W